MRRPRVPITLAVQITTHFRQLLRARAYAVLAVLEQALLISVETFARQEALGTVIQIRTEIAAIEHAPGLMIAAELWPMLA